MDTTIRQAITHLVESSRDAVVCSVAPDGYPNAKAMFRCSNEGLRTFWFSTNTSAMRTAQFRREPRACIYFLDSEGFHGLMLTGRMEVCEDAETKRRFWHEGDEKYYPLGPTDPDYCMLRFTAEKGNYYHGLARCLFDVAETEG